MPIDYSQHTIVITGASSGIGAEFARQLAARGAALVLVARRIERLERLAEELRGRHGATATVIPLDLAVAHAGTRLTAELDRLGIPVTGVVNNAGLGTHGPLHEAPIDSLRQELAVDVVALVDITRALIPRLRPLPEGIIVNVASMAAYQPFPGFAVYAAAKAFVLRFTEALWGEARGTGLRVLSLAPTATETEFFDVLGADADGGMRRQPVDQPVRAALRALDRRNPPPSIASGALPTVAAAVSGIIPRRAVIRAAAWMNARGSR